ncbi:unnamed protein product [Didymodactylos carnosus]|uniref:C2H2-type domain-containing protein n=2 Tax=Didymodactylos carnosus TaxID=1234261 RepID=A0A813NVI6_9BILA|nr:unnamed protein product [Didymodactylos carnosus]CAF3519463.1 unnamed protein product [Didymodactylos carnosus]
MQITNMNIIDTHSPMPSHRPFNSKQQQQQQQQQQRDESSLVLKIKRHTTKNEHEIVRNNEDETTKTCLSRTDNNPVTNKIVKIENDDSTTSTTTALSSDDRENRTTSPSPNTTNNTDNIAVTALSPITGTVSEKKSNRLKKVNNPSKTTKTTTILRQKRLRRNGATATKRSISPVFDIKSQKQQTKTKLQRLSIDSNNNCTTTTENCSKIEQQTKETKGTLSMNSTNSNTSTNHNNQQEDVENDERQTQLPHSKRFKYDKLQKVDASVETASIGVVTEPDNLGPCSPGTTVVLEGIVWNETDSGVLVVNVTWRGKTYVGTLLDSTKLNWAAPRLTCESPTGDFDTRSKNGRNKRGNRCSAPQLFPSISNPLPSNSSTIATGLSLSTTNIEQPTGDRKLRNIKSRQTKRNTITSSTTTTLNDRRQSLNNETTGASADLNPTNDNSILSSLNSPFRTNATTTNFFFEKRCFPPINISSDNQLRPINDSIQTNTTESFLSCHIDNMFRCPETDCYKRYPSVIALRYHLGNAHDKSDWDLNNDNLPQKLECMEKKKDNTIEEISNSIVLNEKVTIKNIVECDDKIIDIKTEIPIIQEYPLTSLLNNVNQKDNELIDQKHSTHEEDVAHILANVADYVRPSTTTTPVPSSITLNQSEHSRSPPLVSIMPSVCSINRISPPLLSSISPNTSLPQTTLSWPSPQSKIILSSPMTSVLSESPCIQNSTSNSLSSPPLPTKLVSTISNNNNNNNRFV